MNGAESLARTLLASGVDVSFTNPGTSEMHFVAALDRVDGMRCVLGLFEGVVTGMADGYARMADKPASTLLHLGPGLGNGLANLHNAKKARSPIVNIVGEHATYHIEHNAPLTADIEGIARPISDWVRTSTDAKAVARDAAEAVAVAGGPDGKIATLILPGDTAWNESDGPFDPLPAPASPPIDAEAIERIAKVLVSSGERAAIHMTGRALRADTLEIAGRIAAKTGCRLTCMTANARWQRGAGRVPVERVQYPIDIALKQLESLDHIVLLGTEVPVAFFAYPNRPSVLLPDGCEVHRLSTLEPEPADVLSALADALDAGAVTPVRQEAAAPGLMTGALTPESIACAIGALLPENAIIADESITSGRGLMPFTIGAAPHDWLALTGGSIGIGMPYATGASIACPDRKVVCLEGDGSGMYTLQALWTQAREGCDVVNVVFANRTYAILQNELANVGAGNPGRKAMDMLDIGRPDLDWCALAKGMGVPATRAETADAFNDQFARALNEPGPHLIEAMI